MKKDAQDIQIENFGKYAVKLFPIYSTVGVILFLWFFDEQRKLIFDYLGPYAKKAILISTLTLIGTLTFLLIRWLIVRKREKKNYQYFRVLPHINQKNDPQNILEMVEQMAAYRRGKHKRMIKGREWFQWLIYRDENEINFYIGFPGDRKYGVLRTLQNAYKDAELHFVPATKEQFEQLKRKARLAGKDENNVPDPLPFPKLKDWSGRMHYDSSGIYQAMPFKRYTGDDGVANLISYMEPGTWIDITFSPSSRFIMRKDLKKAQQKLKKHMPKSSERDSFQKEELKDFSTRLDGRDKVFTVAISIASSHSRARTTVSNIANNLGSVVNDKNGLDFDRVPNAVSFCPFPTTKKLEWTGQELANLLHLPDAKSEMFKEHIRHLEKGQSDLKPNVLSEGVTIGYNDHPIKEGREVKVSWPQLTEHFAIFGQTGSGKSSILMMMFQSIIDEWITGKSKRGFTFLDPASVSALTVLNRLLKAESEGHAVPWEKVHFYSLKNSESPTPMNLLHKNEWEDTDTVVNNIMAIFKMMYPGDRSRIEKYLKNTLTALIDDTEDHTLFGINKFLSDEDWREPIIDRMQDEILKDFWERQDQQDIDTVKEDIYSRVNPFEQSEFMRLMFGQPKWALPLKKYMDEGHLVFIDMSGLGELNTKLIIGHLITQYHQTVQTRKQYPNEHLLVVDESHLAQIPIMEKIIAEDRKFGLILGPATQYIGQFEQWLQDSIDGNVQNIISGAQGEKQSIATAKLLKNKFTPELLQNLPNRKAAVLTKNRTKSQTVLTSCLIQADPPFTYMPTGEIATYGIAEETDAAMEWAKEKAQELQERDGENPEKIREYILDYLGLVKSSSKPAAQMTFKGGDASQEQENTEQEKTVSELVSPPDILDKEKIAAQAVATIENNEEEDFF